MQVPRDRGGTFEPTLVPKHGRRLPALDDKILALYARGMTTRDIQGHLEELYHTAISPTLVSNVTAAVLGEVAAWQSRPLDAVYPVLYLGALFVKVRHEGRVQSKAVYLALCINLDGEKELLGLWIAETEGARFWLGVLTELKNRGVEDVLICCVDGLTGFEEAIQAVFPLTLVQLCRADRPGPSPIWCGTASASSTGATARLSRPTCGRFTAPRLRPRAGPRWPSLARHGTGATRWYARRGSVTGTRSRSSSPSRPRSGG